MFSNIMAVIFLGLVGYLIYSTNTEVNARSIKETKKVNQARMNSGQS